MNSLYKLLVIEDSEDVRNMLTDFFSRKKYQVVASSNGLDALKLFESDNNAFDLVITDLVMPNISGVGVISILKKKNPDIPIIAITGWGEHPEALAMEAQANIVLGKPFQLSELEKHVNKLLSR